MCDITVKQHLNIDTGHGPIKFAQVQVTIDQGDTVMRDPQYLRRNLVQ